MMSYGSEINGNCNIKLMLPPGFRFHPTDEELVLHYLCRKCTALPISVPVIAELDLYKFDPWQLPGMALYGEKEWYFFSPRDRKYPNGSRPNRAAGNGYWKATGADKPIGNPKTLAIKKALVFYSGKAPKGEKTNWIMHEYRLAGVDRSARKKNPSLRLDDWVLCRIYNKKGAIGKQTNPDMKSAKSKKTKPNSIVEPKLEFDQHVQKPQPKIEYLCFDSSESLPKLNCGDSSSSEEHVLSSSNFYDPEVESKFRWDDDDVGDWENALGTALMNEDITDNGFAPMSPLFPIQDMFMQYIQ